MDACPNPLMMSADIAARTEHIRIGQAANIITFWNPLRVAEDIEVYRNARSEAEGRDVALGEGISLVRDMFVAETMDEVRELAGEGILTYLRWIAHWRGLGNHLDPDEELPEMSGKLDLLTYEFLHPRNMLFGTPDYVAEKIEELQTELNLQHLQVWSNFPGVPHDQVMKSVKLFTEEVMPRFEDPSTQAAA